MAGKNTNWSFSLHANNTKIGLYNVGSRLQKINVSPLNGPSMEITSFGSKIDNLFWLSVGKHEITVSSSKLFTSFTNSGFTVEKIDQTVVVVQLTQRKLPTQTDLGSNPVDGSFIKHYRKDENGYKLFVYTYCLHWKSLARGRFTNK